jgi:phosphinothricin acetyltransferase
MSDIVIRRAESGDLPALLAIYNHYVEHTPITFDLEPRTLEQRRVWFDTFAPTGRYQCFVAVDGGVAIGWASSGKFKDRAAYDTSVEMSVYLAPSHHGKGLGRKLYQTIIAALAGEDIHRLYGGVTLPNPASVALHQALGFRRLGVQKEVGRKFDTFWDVALYERPSTP